MRRKKLIEQVRATIKASVSIAAALTLIFVLAGCGGSDEAPGQAKKAAATSEGSVEGQTLPEGHPDITDQPREQVAPSEHQTLKSDKELKLDDEVVKKWSTANLGVTDNSSGQKVDLEVKVGQKVQVDGKTFALVVDAFVPDYTIFDDYIGSRSNEPNNPAIHLSLYEGDKVVASGWIFAELTSFNSYNHIRYSIELKGPFK